MNNMLKRLQEVTLSEEKDTPELIKESTEYWENLSQADFASKIEDLSQDSLKELATKLKGERLDLVNKALKKTSPVGETLSEDWASKEFQELSHKLMPPQGPADTVEGELLRAVNKLVYRYYNDGDYFYQGYGVHTAGAPVAFLLDMAAKLHIEDLTNLIDKAVGLTDDEYEGALRYIEEAVLAYVKSKEGKYTENQYDMLSKTYTKYANSQWDSSEGDEEEEY